MIDFHTVYLLTHTMSLLYIEDDSSFLEESSEVFKELFEEVVTATDGEIGYIEYDQFFQKTGSFFDIVVTDINMPNMNGIELIQKIYEHNPMQTIIVISAHNEPQYLLELVNLGIEQFLLKPNNYDTILNVFHKSASKVLRSYSKEIETSHVHLGTTLLWNKQTSVLYEKDMAIKLTKNETLLMQIFIKNHTKISTLQEIFDTLWGDEPHLACIETLKSIISRLRKKLPTSIIENVYGLGYRLVY
ncbi:response regulator transcription factor [Sulfurospirillum diekertiae]|nr:response regulator transcription factor [Sulfurospirillum diekertiae]